MSAPSAAVIVSRPGMVERRRDSRPRRRANDPRTIGAFQTSDSRRAIPASRWRSYQMPACLSCTIQPSRPDPASTRVRMSRSRFVSRRGTNRPHEMAGRSARLESVSLIMRTSVAASARRQVPFPDTSCETIDYHLRVKPRRGDACSRSGCAGPAPARSQAIGSWLPSPTAPARWPLHRDHRHLRSADRSGHHQPRWRPGEALARRRRPANRARRQADGTRGSGARSRLRHAAKTSEADGAATAAEAPAATASAPAEAAAADEAPAATESSGCHRSTRCRRRKHPLLRQQQRSRPTSPLPPRPKQPRPRSRPKPPHLRQPSPPGSAGQGARPRRRGSDRGTHRVASHTRSRRDHAVTMSC